MAQISEVSADAIFSEDPDGAIMTWNSAAERLYGYSTQERTGRNADFAFATEIVTQPRSAHEPAGSAERFGTRDQRADGRRVAVSLMVSPPPTSAGESAADGHQRPGLHRTGAADCRDRGRSRARAGVVQSIDGFRLGLVRLPP